MSYDRIKLKSLHDKVITAEQAAQLFENGMIVGSSGFTKAGDSKVVLPALAERARIDPLKITLITGASLGHGTDGKLAATSNTAISTAAKFLLCNNSAVSLRC